MIIWMIVGALTGASTACIFPASDDVHWFRKFAGSWLAACGLTFLVFGFAGIDATTNRVFGVAWAAGTVAWLAIPLMQKGGVARLRDIIKERAK